MHSPRFSIVIPTRNRLETLRHALQTCLDQDFDDFEVVVMDNGSDPPAEPVARATGSGRIRVERSDVPLAMSDNWDRGVAAAQGEWVCVLGDDDGLMPYALRELDRLARTVPLRAIRWTAAYYTWPNFSYPEQANYLRLPLGREAQVADYADIVPEVAAFRACYSRLPMLYNAAIHRDLIEELRRRTGRIFACPIPDVYSGFALGYLAGQYLSCELPLSVAGSSGQSSGMANLFFRGKSPLDLEFRALNSQAGFAPDPRIPDLPVFPFVPVAQSFLDAARQLFPHQTCWQLDRRAFLGGCVGSLRCDDATQWQQALAELRASTADDPQLQAWFDQTLAHEPWTPRPAPQLASAERGVRDGFLHLDTSAWGLHNVADVTRFCGRLLSPSASTIQLKAARPQSLERLLLEKERVIQEQARALNELQAQLAAHATSGRKPLLRRIARRLRDLTFGTASRLPQQGA